MSCAEPTRSSSRPRCFSPRFERNFKVAAPDRLGVADLTYLRCWEGLVVFAFVLDAYSRKVVGWQLAAHMRTSLVLDALRMAEPRRIQPVVATLDREELRWDRNVGGRIGLGGR